MKIKAITIGLSALIISTSCKDDGIVKPIETKKITFTEIQQEIFTQSCYTGCHSSLVPSRRLDLSEGKSYQNLVNIKSHTDKTKFLVKPGNSDNSYLMFTLKGIHNSKLMPPKPLPALSDKDIKAVANWIDRGAPND